MDDPSIEPKDIIIYNELKKKKGKKEEVKKNSSHYEIYEDV